MSSIYNEDNSDYEPQLIICEVCNGEFTHEEMENHPDECTPPEGIIICQICRQQFTIEEMSIHVDECSYSSEDDDELFACGLCTEQFTQEEMEIHIDECPRIDYSEILTCHSCYNEFTRRELIDHMDICSPWPKVIFENDEMIHYDDDTIYVKKVPRIIVTML